MPLGPVPRPDGSRPTGRGPRDAAWVGCPDHAWPAPPGTAPRCVVREPEEVQQSGAPPSADHAPAGTTPLPHGLPACKPCREGMVEALNDAVGQVVSGLPSGLRPPGRVGRGRGLRWGTCAGVQRGSRRATRSGRPGGGVLVRRRPERGGGHPPVFHQEAGVDGRVLGGHQRHQRAGGDVVLAQVAPQDGDSSPAATATSTPRRSGTTTAGRADRRVRKTWRQYRRRIGRSSAVSIRRLSLAWPCWVRLFRLSCRGSRGPVPRRG